MSPECKILRSGGWGSAGVSLGVGFGVFYWGVWGGGGGGGLLFLLLRNPCKISLTDDNPFYGFKNGIKKKEEKEKNTKNSGLPKLLHLHMHFVQTNSGLPKLLG